MIRDRLWFFAAYDPGLTKRYFELPGFGLQPDREWSHVFSGKLNWQATPTTNLVLTAVGDPGERQLIENVSQFTGVIPTSSPTPYPYFGRVQQGTVGTSLKALHVARGNLLFEGTLSRVGITFVPTPIVARPVRSMQISKPVRPRGDIP